MQIRRFAMFNVLLLFGMLSVLPVYAQTSAAEGDANANMISELASKLDEDQSAALVRMLEVLAEENEAEALAVADKPGIIQVLSGSIAAFAGRIQDHIVRLPEMVSSAVPSLY